MDEFIKVSPGIKKIIELVTKLAANEVIEIIPDRDRNKKGSYHVRTIRKEVTSEVINNF